MMSFKEISSLFNFLILFLLFFWSIYLFFLFLSEVICFFKDWSIYNFSDRYKPLLPT